MKVPAFTTAEAHEMLAYLVGVHRELAQSAKEDARRIQLQDAEARRNAGPRPEGYPRIVAKDDGFALQTVELSRKGQWVEEQVYFARKREDVAKAARRRKMNVE